MNMNFLLPDRYEGLNETAGNKDVTKIIVPVQSGIEKIEEYYEEIVSSGRGAFLILLGKSGSGKTTFLRTLSIFIKNVEVITISNDMNILEEISSLSKSKYSLRILIIEGRESILDMSNIEVTNAIQTINRFIRTDKGNNTLVVWPCNNQDIVDNLVETSRTVGGTSLLDYENTYFSFVGPDKSQFVYIAKQTVEFFNDGKTLLDFGVTDEVAGNCVEQSETIGEYLKLINRKVRKNKKYISDFLVKKRCNMWVLVLGLNEPSKDVEALTKGENLEADIQRLLISTDANIIQEVKKIPDQIALLSHYLDTKIIYIPIVDALSIIRNYANNDLKKIMKNQSMSLSADTSISERMKNMELVRMIQSDNKLMGKKGVTGSNSKSAFQKLLDISRKNDSLLNDAFGRALLENKYIEDYSTEVDFGEGLTRRTDLLCVKDGEEIRLEFMWRTKTSKAEIANYTLTKLYNYGKALEFIKN